MNAFEHLERIVVLEQEVMHMRKDLCAMSKKVDEMHTIMLQAKGAKWMLMGLAGVAGFLSSLVPKLWH